MVNVGQSEHSIEITMNSLLWSVYEDDGYSTVAVERHDDVLKANGAVVWENLRHLKSELGIVISIVMSQSAYVI